MTLPDSDDGAPDYDREIDCRGLLCPLPVAMAKTALSQMAAGDVLKIVATDPAAALDFKVFSGVNGHPFLHRHEAEGELTFYVCKGLGSGLSG